MKNKYTIFSALFILLICISFSVWATEGVYNAPKVDTPPVIDGIGNDSCWLKASWAPVKNMWLNTINNDTTVTPTDYSGKFKVVWTPQRLYLLFEIVDDSLSCQKTFDISNIYNYDCVEVFIDENHSRGDYSGTYQAFAYHTDTSGHICYARGNYGWEQLNDHIKMKVKKVAPHTYDWEYEIKVFNDSYNPLNTNIPDILTVGKLMGWSVAYNDNDGGTMRQSMFGSKFIAGTDKNISYYNSSAFGQINLVMPADTGTEIINTAISKHPEPNSMECQMLNNGNKLQLRFNSSNTGIYEVQVFDITGKLIVNKKIMKTLRQQDETIDTSAFHQGMYLIRANGSGRVYTSKIIFQGTR